MHGRMHNGSPTGATQEKVKGLEQKRNSLGRVETGEMWTSAVETSADAGGLG